MSTCIESKIHIESQRLASIIINNYNLRLDNGKKSLNKTHICGIYTGVPGKTQCFLHGLNSDRENRNGCCYTQHAEMYAISKFASRNTSIKSINLMIIRTDSHGDIKMSKPCQKCIQHMRALRNCKINNVYYSGENGILIKTNLTKLYNEKMHVSSRFRRNI